MKKQYSGVICRGSYLLNSACGHCEKCEDERESLINSSTILKQDEKKWNDAKEVFPKKNQPVLLYVRCHYECEEKKYHKDFMMEGMYDPNHIVATWYDAIGDELDQDNDGNGEEVLAWREKPDKPEWIVD